MTAAQKQLAIAKRLAKASSLETKFLMMWKALRGPVLNMETVFAPPRRWRFDFSFEKNVTLEDIHVDGLLPVRIAIELEGGIWTGGRHVRGAGFQGDLEKYFVATAMGWRAFRLSGAMLTPRYLEPIIELCR